MYLPSPSGWDNEGKINILLENSTTIKSDSEFSEVISKPSIRKPMQRDVETVVAIEDQDFLSKLQIVLNKTSTPSLKQEDIPTGMNASVNTSVQAKTPQSKPPKIGTNPNAPDSTNLKNFFQNLLNKNAPLSSPVTTNANQDSTKDIKNESSA